MNLAAKILVTLVVTASAWFFSASCAALEPAEILVIANRNASGSVGLAEYYMKARNIPEANLVKLWVTDKEWCSREEYERKVVPQVRRYVEEHKRSRPIRCLLLMYGVPLKVNPPEMTAADKRAVEELRKKESALRKLLKRPAGQVPESKKKLEAEVSEVQKRIAVLTQTDERASLDSELALVQVADYPKAGWTANPFFLGFKNQKLPIERENVLMVSRLDGPSREIVKRVINDSIEAEKKGLSGTAYFDARWPDPAKTKDAKQLQGYAFYDASIHKAAEQVRKSGKLAVVVNDKPELFQKGECPNAALYCGWYSLARYVDAFQWQPGAIGFHIASSECQTLKSPDSQVWCKRMLEEGVAATLGPVSEPYVQAFPVPEVFFATLLDGRLALAECYALSVPFWSWQMVLIGDPLYRPFGRQ